MGLLGQLKKFLPKQESELEVFNSIKKQFMHDGEPAYAGDLLRLASIRYPNNQALIAQEGTLTYQEFYLRSLLLSKKISALGVKPHDRFVIYTENSLAFYIAYFAAWQVGAVVVPLNIFLHKRELIFILNDALPKVIFTLDGHRAILDEIVQEHGLHQVPAIITDREIDWQSSVSRDAIKQAEAEVVLHAMKPDEMCVLLYTSGTTGIPKGVMLSSRNVVANAMQAYARFKMFGNLGFERFFCVLPLFHVFAQNACLWLPVMTGSSVIIVRKIDRKLIRDGLELNPTIFLGFPALYGLLCIMRTAPLKSIKAFISGADALPDKIRSAFATIYGRRICSGYGLTEASPVIAVNHYNESFKTSVVGHPLVGISCDIRNENGESLGKNKIGTLWVKGDNIMLGYYNAPDATAQVLQDGWLNTGDLAVIDSEGILAITGRSKDLIIHKGFNIYPQEIENILMLHPVVFKVAVVGRDEASSGQIPVAYVAVRAFDKDLENSLRELCTNNLAGYKVPRKIICLEDLPMNATGKVDKKQLVKFD